MECVLVRHKIDRRCQKSLTEAPRALRCQPETAEEHMPAYKLVMDNGPWIMDKRQLIMDIYNGQWKYD